MSLEDEGITSSVSMTANYILHKEVGFRFRVFKNARQQFEGRHLKCPKGECVER